MTERQKQLAIIAGTIILAILLLIHFRRGTGAAGATAGSDYQLPAVVGPQLGPIFGGGGYGSGPIIIPGLDLSGPNLNMIGACCSDCMSSPQAYTTPAYSGPSFTYNQGNAGASIFNYQAAYQQQQYVMTAQNQ